MIKADVTVERNDGFAFEFDIIRAMLFELDYFTSMKLF